MQVDWDKGKALLHLLTALGLGEDSKLVPIYIGDDRTDEDAFKALRSRPMGGTGILVSSKVGLQGLLTIAADAGSQDVLQACAAETCMAMSHAPQSCRIVWTLFCVRLL